MNDDEVGSKNGGTGQLGPKPSPDATAGQTPTQPEVPVWMLARNNSVHAPVFGQPSEPKSTSRKLPSMPSFAFGPKGSKSPWAEIRTAIRANNANSEARASPTPPQPSPSVALNTLNDDQALALLLKNETVARLFQNAFNTRVEEHQQKLERAYNQRLIELEEYTRSWRDYTKELWVAVSEGTFNPDKDQQESLRWKDPQEAEHDSNPERTTVSREIVEKEFDSDGRVACNSLKQPPVSHSTSPFNHQEWINSNGCGSKNFKRFGHKIRSVVNFDENSRLLFRHTNEAGKFEYRSLKAIDSTAWNISDRDVIVELTPSNVAVVGKAFCYLKDSRDRIFPQDSNNASMADVSATELDFLYNRFSQEPTKRHVDVLPLYIGKQLVTSGPFAVKIDVSAVPKRLFIARPTYKPTGGVNGAKFFDVGSDTYTTDPQNGEEIVLFEDKAAFSRLTLLLCFCIRMGIVSVSLTTTLPVPIFGRIPFEAGNPFTSLQDDQVPHHSSTGIVPESGQNSKVQEWITDIKGLKTDFISTGKISLLMRSPHLPGRDFSKFLAVVPKCGRLIFRLRDPLNNITYFSWKGNKIIASPALKRGDIMVECSIPNLVLFWKAFCILKDRNEYLLSGVAGPLSELNRKVCGDLYEKLAKHYGCSLLGKQQATSIQCASLPVDVAGHVEEEHLSRRLLIARPYHQGQQVVNAEFFDAGSNSRTGRQPTDIVLAEDTATLTDIGRIFERSIQEDVFPGMKKDRTSVTSPSTRFTSPKSGVPPQMTQGGEPGQSGKVFGALRSPLDTSKTLHNAGLEQQKRRPVSKSFSPPQPSLFQRTLALSDGLKELRDESRRGQSNTQAHSQWLAIGGEPQDVCSPPSRLDQDRIAESRSQAHDVEEEVLPFRLTNQRIHDDPSDGSENSDLIMLDEQPKDIVFRCRKKRPLPAAGQRAKTAKKPKLSTVEPSTVLGTQLLQNDPCGQAPQSLPNLPLGSFTHTEGLDKEHLGKPTPGSLQSQDDQERKRPHMTSSSEHHQVVPSTVPQTQSIPLGEQHPVMAFSPLPLLNETIARRTHELREQLRQLGCRFEVNGDQVGEGTIGGNIENSGQLQADEAFRRPPTTNEMTASYQLREKLRQLGCRFEDNIDKVDESTIRRRVEEIEQLQTSIKRFEGMLETQRHIEDRQKADQNLRSGAHLPSLGVLD